MKGWGWSLACLTAVVGGGCARTEPAPRPAPTPAPVVVSGSLQEGYTGRPITTGEVILGGYAGPKTEYTVFATAALDAGGRFRFERVAHRADMTYSQLGLEWTPGQAGRALLREEDARRPDYREAAQDAPGFGRERVTVDLQKVAGTAVDLGTVSIWLETAAENAFGPACQRDRTLGVVPAAAPVVMFHRSGPRDTFSVANFRQPDIASIWPQWKGVACITAVTDKVGTYTQSGFGDGSTAAYKTTWAVRVVRLPEGRVFRTTISADPPQAIKLDANGRPADGSSDVEGDPKPALREWLAGLAM